MNRANLIGLLGVLTVVALVVTPSRTSGDDIKKLPEGGLKFNSKLALRVFVVDENGASRVIGKTPAATPLAIPRCRFWCVQPLERVSPAAVREEAKSQPIKGIKLETASDADLAQLSGWPELQMLDLRDSQITDAGLVSLKGLKALRRLDFRGTKVTNPGLANFKDLKFLQIILLDTKMVGGPGITDADLAELKAYKQLQGLYIRDARITDAGLIHLKELKALGALSLHNSGITDASLAYIKDLKELSALLDLSGNKITDAGLAYLREFKALGALDLSDTRITDAGLARLEELNELRSLDLARTNITDAGLVHLRKLTNLQWLGLSGTRISDAGLPALKKLKKLSAIVLVGTGITDAGFEDMLEAMPQIQVDRFAAVGWEANIEMRLLKRFPKLDFDAIPLAKVFEFLRDVSNVNIVADPDCELADKKVTCHLQDMTFRAIFPQIVHDQRLSYRIQDGAVYVFKESRPHASLALLAPDAPAWKKKLREKIGRHIPKLDFNDTELGMVMDFLQEISGIKVSLSEGVDKTAKVNIHITDLRFEHALNLICQMHRLQYRLTEDGLVVQKLIPAE